MKVWTTFVLLESKSGAGSYEYGNEFSGSIKGEGFLDYLSYC
jgi:hypothetical protein